MSLNNDIHRTILDRLKYCWFQYTDSSGVNHSIKTEEVVSIRDDISKSRKLVILRTRDGHDHRVPLKDEKMVHTPIVFGPSNREGPMPEVVVSNVEDDSEQMPQLDMGVEYIFAVTSKPEMNYLHLPLDSWLFNAGGERNGFLWMTQHPVKSMDGDSWYVWRSERKITGDIGNPGANDSNIGKGRWSHPSMMSSYNARGGQ